MENPTTGIDSINEMQPTERAAILINQATVLGKRGEYDAALPIIERALTFATIAQNTSQTSSY